MVTVSQNSELSNPEYLFSFTHIFSKQNVSFIPLDVSLHKSRYDEFYFVEGLECDEIHFPYEGQYLYSISEQPAGSGNLNPALAYNVVENGEAQIIVQSAITVNSQFDVFISSNEDNSNFIFAPDEPNPTPNITCTPTQTPNQPTPTPTPSITPTFTPTNTQTPSVTPTHTPTPSSTPTILNPSNLGALWWVDYTDPNNIILDNTCGYNNLAAGRDLISGNFIFSAGTIGTCGGPTYSGTGYNNVSGATLSAINGLSTALSVYSGLSISAYTFFTNARLADVNSAGAYVQSDNEFNYLNEQQGYRWFEVDAFQSGQPNIRTYSFYTNGQSVNPEPRTEDLNPNDFYFVATRVSQSGSTASVAIFVDGILDDDNNSNYTILTATDPIFSLSRNGNGGTITTEEFFFDRALTDNEMNQMWYYLQSKYPNQ